ncbi:hypothetical protein [Pseudoruegeria sp. HB172150]|uniref:hypothetical protein n=1 Tax=Pseudoruegeria sp. HB172150 TaxID=2721164 RepID=UPI001556A824|nr:hypothetical protein [Pseudoruegeria sp. HB172150]
MYKLAAISLVFVMGATGLSAQQTYKEELYESGSLTLSNMESHIKSLLEDNGVSADCMGNLYSGDVASMNSIINDSDLNSSEKRSEVKAILDRRC